jgi:hypothetical protein
MLDDTYLESYLDRLVIWNQVPANGILDILSHQWGSIINEVLLFTYY